MEDSTWNATFFSEENLGFLKVSVRGTDGK